MTTPAQFQAALAITESGDNPEAWGDQGLAMGAWQVHPAWLWDQIRSFQIKPAVRSSWNSWVETYIEAFFHKYADLGTPTEIAMHFHLGHASEPGDVDWDAEYASRFEAALAKVAAAS
jgi:hypothetical protein